MLGHLPRLVATVVGTLSGLQDWLGCQAWLGERADYRVERPATAREH